MCKTSKSLKEKFIKTKIKAYISGPMTGIEDYNYPAFFEVEGNLNARGIATVNPARHFKGNQKLPMTKYMRRDYRALLLEGCTHIFSMKGWTSSRGAMGEHIVAYQIGLGRIQYYRGDPHGELLINPGGVWISPLSYYEDTDTLYLTYGKHR